MLSEQDYRAKLQATFDRIASGFEDVDPDVAECEQALGSLTITLADRSRCILSAQPSVRQLWLALAAKGTAHHFNWDDSRQAWIDDKGKGFEVVSFLRDYFRESCRLELEI
jgi:CyaY protein